MSDVLDTAPMVRILATSREPLPVPGELVIPVPPLELPQSRADEPLERVQQTEAVSLFAERAAAASGKFTVMASNQAAVVAICRRLDGLPLAIELAAVRTRALSVEQIARRLNDRFGLLPAHGRGAFPRHETLRTAIDWSYDLLSSEERILLRLKGGKSRSNSIEPGPGACYPDPCSYCCSSSFVLSVLA